MAQTIRPYDNNRISLRKATSEDVSFLLNLRRLTMLTYLKHAGMPCDEEAMESRVRYGFDHARIVEYDGQDVGLFKRAYDCSTKRWDLMQIQVHPDFQGHGIGSYLLDQLIDRADQMNADIWLSVIDSNPAYQLYKRKGFELVKVDGKTHILQRKAY